MHIINLIIGLIITLAITGGILYLAFKINDWIDKEMQIMENNNLRYQEYKQYINQEWEEGNINELEEGGWLAIESIDEKGNVNYRHLTEEEYHSKLLEEEKESND